jgi:hypothetical protein
VRSHGLRSHDVASARYSTLWLVSSMPACSRVARWAVISLNGMAWLVRVATTRSGERLEIVRTPEPVVVTSARHGEHGHRVGRCGGAPSSAAQPNRLRSPSISMVPFMATRCRSPGVRRFCLQAHLHGAAVCPLAHARGRTTWHDQAATIAMRMTRQAGGHDHAGIPGVWLRPLGFRSAGRWRRWP